VIVQQRDSQLQREYELIERETPSSAEGIYRVMSAAILSGTIPLSERLTEGQIARTFAVSRTPAREALKRLEADGLASRNDQGHLVVIGFTREQILEIYAVREVLDGLAARLAAEFRTPLHLADLERLSGQMLAAADATDYSHMQVLNVQFHEVMAEASHNTVLLRFVRDIHRSVRRFRSTTFESPGRAHEAIFEHRGIIAALEKRDGALAEETARRHMRAAAGRRIQMFAAELTGRETTEEVAT
jgi:DNA-binding GntR family transcriptional regulator